MNYYNYFTEIEETFVRRRGKHLLLSPIDWAMIEGWQDRGVPLHVVIRAIQTVFDAYEKKPSNRSIKSLLFCREEIEAQYAEWIAAQAGRDSGGVAVDAAFDKAAIEAHIDHTIQNLRASTDDSLKEDFERASRRLEELKADLSDDFEIVDKSLCDIEGFLDIALLTRSDPHRRKAIEKDTAAQLKTYKAGMEPDVYKKTFDLMVLKRLREEAGVPRLGLFYL